MTLEEKIRAILWRHKNFMYTDDHSTTAILSAVRESLLSEEFFKQCEGCSCDAAELIKERLK